MVGVPVRHFLARRAPEFAPVLHVIGGEELFTQHVALHDDPSLVQHRRRGEAPLQGRRIPRAGVHLPEIATPKLFALHVEAEQTLRAEDRHDAATVGRRSGVAMGRLGVPLLTRHRLMAGLVPKNFSRGFVETEQPPFVLFLFRVGRAAAVVADFQLRLRPRSHGRREVKAVTPDDRTRVAQTGNRHLPPDVLAGPHLPPGRRDPSGNSAGLRAAELRPVGIGRGVYGSAEQQSDEWVEFHDGNVGRITSVDSTKKCRPARTCRRPAGCWPSHRGRPRCSRSKARRGPAPSGAPPSCGRGRDARGRHASRW